MDSKLTLKLNQDVIAMAKEYAKNKNISLSKLIEAYLDMLVSPKDGKKITPLVNSLSGIVQLPKNFEHKKEYRKHLSSKYGR